MDGDGVSTYGDQVVFNHWLALGGSLKHALESAAVETVVLGLTDFFSSSSAALTEDAEILSFGAPAGGGEAQAQGSTCFDLAAEGAPPQRLFTLLPAGGTWRYFRGLTGAPPAQGPLTWKDPGYNDTAAGFMNGAESIGFGDAGESYLNTNVGGTFVTLYLRRQFTLTAGQEPLNIGKLFIRTRYDDGFIAYLNGARVLCVNMTPAGCQSPAFNTLAASSHEGNAYEWFELDLAGQGAALVVGTNTFAVEVHNFTTTSSDLVFGLDPSSEQNESGPVFFDSEQIQWLCQDLAAARRFWKVVYFHHPAHCTASASTAVRNKLGPIFDKYRVDLALQGHAHLYERTVPVFNGTGTGRRIVCSTALPLITPAYENHRSPTFGTIYLTTGGGGRSADNPGTPITQSDVLFDGGCTASSAYHVTLITSTRDTLTIEPIDKDGNPLEIAALTKDFPPFLRGDVDSSGDIDISDPYIILNFLFGGTTSPFCLDACDANDNGQVTIADSQLLFDFLFSGGPPPAAPFPNCAPDPTADNLSCEYHASGYPGCEAPFDATCPVSCP